MGGRKLQGLQKPHTSRHHEHHKTVVRVGCGSAGGQKPCKGTFQRMTSDARRSLPLTQATPTIEAQTCTSGALEDRTPNRQPDILSAYIFQRAPPPMFDHPTVLVPHTSPEQSSCNVSHRSVHSVALTSLWLCSCNSNSLRTLRQSSPRCAQLVVE